jgi:hypothetical protein
VSRDFQDSTCPRPLHDTLRVSAPLRPGPCSLYAFFFIFFRPAHDLFALRDEKLYQWLAMVDAIRFGRARERDVATSIIEKHLSYEGN